MEKKTKNTGENITVTLGTPIQRGETQITEVTLREPVAGTLRGLNLMDVAMMNAQALTVLIPRISQPILTEAEVKGLSAADLMTVGTEVAGFLVPRSIREEFPST